MSPVQHHEKFQFCSKKTRLLRKLQSSQVNCNSSSGYTLDKQFSNWGNGSLVREEYTSESNKGRAVAAGRELEGEGHTLTDHRDAALQCPRPWQPQALTHCSSFWLLYSRDHPRVTSFSDPGPPQVPFSSSHLLICYYCWSPVPVRAQLSPACWRKKTCSADHSAGSLCRPGGVASYRAKLIAGPPDHAAVMAAALSGYEYIKFQVSSYNCDKFSLMK